MPQMRSWSAHPLAGFALVVGAACLFGTLGPVSRFANEAGLEPLALVGWRALIGTIVGIAFVAWRVRSGRTSLVRLADVSPSARVMLGLAATAGFLLNAAMFVAFNLVTIALALLAFYTFPAIVAVVGVALGHERLDRPRAVALLLALGGMAAVVAGPLDASSGMELNWLGIALALGAAVCQATFVLISRDGYRVVPTDQAMTVVIATTVLCAVPLAAVTGQLDAFTFPLREPGILPLVLFAGVFGAAIPSFAFLAGIRAIGGLRAGILMLFEPVVGVVLAALLLHEGVVPVQAAGGAAILAAAVILQRSSGDAPTIEPAATPASEDGSQIRAAEIGSA